MSAFHMIILLLYDVGNAVLKDYRFSILENQTFMQCLMLLQSSMCETQTVTDVTCPNDVDKAVVAPDVCTSSLFSWSVCYEPKRSHMSTDHCALIAINAVLSDVFPSGRADIKINMNSNEFMKVIMWITKTKQKNKINNAKGIKRDLTKFLNNITVFFNIN